MPGRTFPQKKMPHAVESSARINQAGQAERPVHVMNALRFGQ